mmetsp:Transcript_14716/g.32193  ORF Transcript_14716/g.32193 Transcript_14716/m.32193 type:complete len:227 (+) Transcript_14716:321-1001(+)
MHCGHRWVHAHLLSVVVQGCEQEGGLRRDSTHTLDQLLCHLSVCPHLHRQHQHGLVGCGRCLCRLLGQRRGLQHLGRLVGFEVGLHRLVEPRQPRAHRVLVHQRHHRTVHGQLQALVGLGQSGTAGQCLRHVDALQQIQSQRASLAGSLPGQPHYSADALGCARLLHYHEVRCLCGVGEVRASAELNREAAPERVSRLTQKRLDALPHRDDAHWVGVALSEDLPQS